MPSELKETLESVRRLSAAGDFAAARSRLEGAPRPTEASMRNLVHRQTLTLEVLEGLDVVRQLLERGKIEKASRTAERIAVALEKPDYAALSVAASAQALLDRAATLTRRIDSGDRTAATREELAAFVQHLAQELSALEHESVGMALEAAGGSTGAGSSTLGDLLSRKPWRSGVSPAVGAAEYESQASAAVALAEPAPARPVPSLRRRPAVAAESGDVFEQLGRAALDYWHVVLFSALLFAAFGYLGVIATQDRYESTSLLRRAEPSTVRAPITSRPKDYLPHFDGNDVLALVNRQEFHARVARRLAEIGWGPGHDPNAEYRKHPIEAEAVGAALQVSVDDTASQNYLITFRARHSIAQSARAIAAAAADEYRVVHIEKVLQQADTMLAEFKQTQEASEADLQEIRRQMLDEFETEDVLALGKTLEDRVDTLVRRIQASREELTTARNELQAAEEEHARQIVIRDRLPEFDPPLRDSRIEERRRKLSDLERELRELSRRVEPFGPEHPDHKRVSELEEEVELLQAEIKALEDSVSPPGKDPPLNRDRAMAEDRVAKAQKAVSLNQGRIKDLNELLPRLEAELDTLRDNMHSSRELRQREQKLVSDIERNDVRIKEIMSIQGSAGLEISLFAPASPAERVRKESVVGIVMGVVLGLVVGLAAAMVLLRRRGRLA